MSIPYADLDISSKLQSKLESDPPPQVRLALATGRMCESDAERLGLCVLLAGDEDELVAETAKNFLSKWGTDKICQTLHRQTHAKVLEYLIEFMPQDDRLDEEVFRCVHVNSRTALIIAGRGNDRVCDEISKNKQQLLLNPEIIYELQRNAKCTETAFSRVESFLRMQQALPKDYSPDGPPPVKSSSETNKTPAPKLEMDLEAEIMAALSGQQSPSLLRAQESFEMFNLDDSEEDDDALGGFSFDFSADADDDFSWDLTSDDGGKKEEEGEQERISMEMRINNMSVGHRIKLAYRGNKEARGILIRDTNKSVAVAVVKSGRLTDGEVANYAGNKNLADDVIREISTNKEYTRKYPVQVALVNNPKTPPSTALGIIGSLHKKDLQNLARNRNVSGVVKSAANKRYREKFRRA